jgi:riboflavin kinase / FMN adenylyltransferase
MTTLDGIDGLRKLPPGAVVSIGNFDGIHLGHESILATMRSLRERSNAPAMAVVTFEPHPLTVLRPESVPPRLTPPGMKNALLAERGVDVIVTLPPAPEVLDLSAERFWGSSATTCARPTWSRAARSTSARAGGGASSFCSSGRPGHVWPCT